jgi:hypothetical protein
MADDACRELRLSELPGLMDLRKAIFFCFPGCADGVGCARWGLSGQGHSQKLGRTNDSRSAKIPNLRFRRCILERTPAETLA